MSCNQLLLSSQAVGMLNAFSIAFATLDRDLVLGTTPSQAIRLVKFFTVLMKLLSENFANAVDLVKDWLDSVAHVAIGNELTAVMKPLRRGFFSQKGLPIFPFLTSNMKKIWTTDRQWFAAQLSSVKRSLPYPDPRVVNAALEKHRENLSKETEVPDWFLGLLSGWSNDLAGALKPKIVDFDVAFKLTMSSSAVIESPQAKGGKTAAILKIVDEYKASGESFLTGKFKGFNAFLSHSWGDRGTQANASFDGVDTWDPKVAPRMKELAVIARCLEKWNDSIPRNLSLEEDRWGEDLLMVDIEELYPILDSLGISHGHREVRAAAVLEQGLKCRVVTVNHDWFSILAHAPRMWMFEALKRNPEIPSLDANAEGGGYSVIRVFNEQLKKVGGLPPDWEFNSLDLSNATDTMEFSVARSLFCGFLQRATGPYLSYFGAILKEHYRPVKVIYPPVSDGKGGRTKPIELTTKRGLLMGDPCSWVALNLWTQSLWHIAGANFEHLEVVDFKCWSEVPPLRKPTTLFDPMVLRCGDDQIAMAPRKRCRLFESLLKLTGAVLSPGVHAGSRTGLFYTKSFLRYDAERNEIIYLDIFPPRSITGVASTREGSKKYPVSYTRGTALVGALFWFPLKKETKPLGDGLGEVTKESWNPLVEHVPRLFFQFHFDFLEKLFSLGIPPFLPRSLGGYGAVSPRGHYLFTTKAMRKFLTFVTSPDANYCRASVLTFWAGNLWTPSIASKSTIKRYLRFLSLIFGSSDPRLVPEDPRFKTLEPLSGVEGPTPFYFPEFRWFSRGEPNPLRGLYFKPMTERDKRWELYSLPEAFKAFEARTMDMFREPDVKSPIPELHRISEELREITSKVPYGTPPTKLSAWDPWHLDKMINEKRSGLFIKKKLFDQTLESCIGAGNDRPMLIDSIFEGSRAGYLPTYRCPLDNWITQLLGTQESAPKKAPNPSPPERREWELSSVKFRKDGLVEYNDGSVVSLILGDPLELMMEKSKRNPNDARPPIFRPENPDETSDRWDSFRFDPTYDETSRAFAATTDVFMSMTSQLPVNQKPVQADTSFGVEEAPEVPDWGNTSFS